MWKNLSVAVLAAGVMAGVGASCGNTPKNVCVDKNIRCAVPLICDPGDGVCKCGGRGGVVCPDGSSCDPVANTCVSKKCDNVDCTDKPGTSCDIIDGQCKCGGTGGTVCGASQLCNPNAKACVEVSNCNDVACPLNQTCDSASGHCRCGTGSCNAGETCTIDQSNQKVCVASNCTGVACSGTTVCDPTDGLCKCHGVVCQSGQACVCPNVSDAGCAAEVMTCQVSALCSNVRCNNGTTCDPSDGQCKCGGPGGPVCASNQICNLGPPPHCAGGQQCVNPDGGAKVCAGGTSCDPEDGQCKCGGRGGVVCAPAGGNDGGSALAEICVANPVQRSCRRPCDVRSPDCDNGTYCYFDSSAATPASYCAAPTDSKGEDDACTTATACFSTVPGPRSLHCLGLALGQTGLCRAYCDTAAGTAGCLQDRPRTCLSIPMASMGTGYCNPQ